jgi:hypothetical protein
MPLEDRLRFLYMYSLARLPEYWIILNLKKKKKKIFYTFEKKIFLSKIYFICLFFIK